MMTYHPIYDTIKHLISKQRKFTPHCTQSFFDQYSLFQTACRITHIIAQFFVLCNYFWMLSEGLYLHTVIVVAVFSENHNLLLYYIVGWGKCCYVINKKHNSFGCNLWIKSYKKMSQKYQQLIRGLVEINLKMLRELYHGVVRGVCYFFASLAVYMCSHPQERHRRSDTLLNKKGINAFSITADKKRIYNPNGKVQVTYHCYLFKSFSDEIPNSYKV